MKTITCTNLFAAHERLGKVIPAICAENAMTDAEAQRLADLINTMCSTAEAAVAMTHSMRHEASEPAVVTREQAEDMDATLSFDFKG